MDAFDPANKEEAAAQLLQQAYDLQMAGKVDDAIALYLKSIASQPTAEAHTCLGWAYSVKGRFGDAIRECEKAVRLDPGYGNPYNDIGAYLIETGRWEDAIPWLEKAAAAERYDGRFYAWYNLGRVWEHQGDWAQALDAYRHAAELNPEYSLAAKAVSRMQSMLN
ncbi:MAG TPA: tetratricopeptide repeat protein [Candidatus Omnitrophota bacterium]|nr:tetratricopeptide repeat protein [Candidatus Omnitrophota bacterium]HRY85024.1 tetratricopeptide repeat protein [Candidatus Omnitrophota bacterium]